MANKWVSKIARFSSLMKVLTVISIVSLLLAYLCPFIHPETMWLIPFFGLAYPIIVCIAFFFLLYWALLRSRWFFYVLGTILLGGTLHFRTLAVTFSPEEPTETEESWKIMSYNVRLFDLYNASNYDRNKNRNGIISYIHEMDPDVICFQEFYHQDKPTTFSTKDTLIELLKFRDAHERYSHKITGRQNFGVCMLSKYPMIHKGNVPFADSEESDNYCIYADIVKNRDTFRIYNVHLQSIKLQQDDYAILGTNERQAGGEKSTFRLLLDKLRIAYPRRAEQARAVAKDIESSPYPVIVCGDFNDTPLSYVYNQFDKKLIDSFRESSNGLGVTYAGKIPAGRIDYIFHAEGLLSHRFKIQENPFSDHRAIYCEIWKRELKD